MDRQQIEALLNEVREGRTEVADALERLRDLPFEDWASPSWTIIARCAPACPR